MRKRSQKRWTAGNYRMVKLEIERLQDGGDEGRAVQEGLDMIDSAAKWRVACRDGRDARRSACRAAVFNENRKEQDDFNAAAGATSGESSTVRKLSPDRGTC